jgi:hypothetical protein
MLECWITVGWKGLQGTKHSLLLVPFSTYEDFFVNTAPDDSSGQDRLFGNPVCLYTAHLPVAVKPGDCLHLHP